MRIAFVAAGAANMICGSCLRDNAVALALKRLGQDAHIIPLYTPLRIDRDAMEPEPVFLGGANIYLQERFGFFRRFAWFDRALDSRFVMSLLGKASGAVDAERLGPLTVATLQGESGPLRKEFVRFARWLAEEFKPEIVNLPNSMLIGAAREIRARTGAPVVCSLTGEDLFIEALKEPFKSRAIEALRERAREVDAFIAIGRYYAERMAELLDVAPDRIHVASTGLDPRGFGRTSERVERPFTIGYLARIAPEKGLHQLVEALAELRAMPGAETARVRAAGWISPAGRRYLKECQEALSRRGLADAFEYIGEVTFEEKVRFLDSIDVLSTPTVYREPKALFALEALAHGVPIVQPAHGVFPELIEATGGGLLYEPGDARAHARALYELAMDPERRDRMGRAGREVVLERYTDERMARATLEIYNRVLAGSQPRQGAERDE